MKIDPPSPGLWRGWQFFAELKRRNVYKVAVAYAVVGWLLIQVATQVFPFFEIPNWAVRLVVLAIVVGFPISLVMAWAFELTPEGIRRTEDISPLQQKGTKSHAWIYVVAVGAALSIGLFFLGRYSASNRTPRQDASAVRTEAGVSEKSVAVLPFENLSDDKSNAYFADGIHDEILTTLAKVADLKVISRTSVMQFKDPGRRNLQEIAQALRVEHVLEGSVQRSGNRVRVNAQLIDARTDTHLWAERYDRDLADVFAIQSEIAQKIVQQLQSVLSPREQATIKAKPTNNIAAYDFYLRGMEVDRNSAEQTREKWNETLQLFEQAVAQDQAFVPALCQLARAHLAFYWFNFDHTEKRLAAAKKALEAAATLQPDAAEVHVARAFFHYWGYRDYSNAVAQLEAARRVSPNDADIILTIALVERRQGRWQEAIGHFEAALALDPRNVNSIGALSEVYLAMGQYDKAAQLLDNALTWRPNDFDLHWRRALIDRDRKADLRPAREAAANPALISSNPDRFAAARIRLALWERDYARARELLASYRSANFSRGAYFTPREWYEGLTALRLGDRQKAEVAFLAGREIAAAASAANNEDAKALIILAEFDAHLGRKKLAVEEGERARALLPIEKDAFDGAEIETRLAGVYAEVGETDHAIALLERRLQQPTHPSYGDLMFDQMWEPMRSLERFQRLVASVAPQNQQP